MELVKNDIKILHDCNNSGVLKGKKLLQFLELCGRNAYKSEWKITEDSCNKFLRNIIIPKQHNSVLEHGEIYLTCYKRPMLNNLFLRKVAYSPSTKLQEIKTGKGVKCYIYTNLRVIRENYSKLFDIIISEDYNNLPEGLSYFEPKELDPYRRISMRMICDRGIMSEIIRQRVHSFTIESTRYIKYKEGISYINNKDYYDTKLGWFLFKLHSKFTEFIYNLSLKAGERPQIARQVLNHGTKTDIIISGFACDFNKTGDLRRDFSSHPIIRPFGQFMFTESY